MPVNIFWQWNFKRFSIKFNLKNGYCIQICSGCAVGTNKSSYLRGFMCKNLFLVRVKSAAGLALLLQCPPSRWGLEALDGFHLVEGCCSTWGPLVMRLLKRTGRTVRYHFTAASLRMMPRCSPDYRLKLITRPFLTATSSHKRGPISSLKERSKPGVNECCHHPTICHKDECFSS